MTNPLVAAKLPPATLEQLNSLRQQVPFLAELDQPLENCFTTPFLRCDTAAVMIGQAQELNAEQHQRLQTTLLQIRPWKKGPFAIFGHYIDAEWRSDWKWQRLQPHLHLKDKIIADIGCHNGYYMDRMLADEPAAVIGFEPVAKHYKTFQFLQGMHPTPTLSFEPLGVEHIHLYEKIFDCIFCLGILYHHTDPITILRQMHRALAKEGELIVDCQGIPGEAPIALMPAKRYAGARAIWFLPTLKCLKTWLQRTNFKDIEVIYSQPLSTQEQRTTEWAPIKSLADYLDPADPQRTIEGYPAPWRMYVKARKG
jgi:tRNA (mo5U34)-methyltransferase